MMNNKKFYCIANWKMYFSWKESSSWINSYKQELASLNKQTTLIICPSFESLSACALQKENFFIGGQDCSPHSLGGYTGQVSAQSLQELGATYCLIGHNETRKAYQLDNLVLYKKLEQCVHNNLIPVFCIGETTYFDTKEIPIQFLHEQLEPLKKIQENYPTSTFLIAYEPVWAIGTGIVASNKHISSIFDAIKKIINNKAPLLYGGTVNAQTIATLKTIPLLDGVLVGKASTDFQELKKIVS